MRARLQHEDKFMHELRDQSHKLQNEPLLFMHSPWTHIRTMIQYLHATQTCRPIIPLVRDTFTFFKCGLNGCKEIHTVVKLLQEKQQNGNVMQREDNVLICFWRCQIPELHTWQSVCCDAQLSMQYAFGEPYKGLYSFRPILPVRSPSLAVPSSYCSSYGNIKKQRCIQDWQMRAKTPSKHSVYHYWQEWWGYAGDVRAIQFFFSELFSETVQNKRHIKHKMTWKEKLQNGQKLLQKFYSPTLEVQHVVHWTQPLTTWKQEYVD